jgi:hypothetical protein
MYKKFDSLKKVIKEENKLLYTCLNSVIMNDIEHIKITRKIPFVILSLFCLSFNGKKNN